MKIHIIGGGIAGLSLGVALSNFGLDYCIYESDKSNNLDGLGYIILKNGLDALEKIGLYEEVKNFSLVLKQFIITSDSGQVLREESKNNTVSITRANLMKILYKHIPKDNIIFSRKFDSFEGNEYQKFSINTEKIIKANFLDGESIKSVTINTCSDIIVGADGINSSIRKCLYPNIKLLDSGIREISNFISYPGISDLIGDSFLECHYIDGGMIIGLLCLGNNEAVLYMVYDSHKFIVTNITDFFYQKIKTMKEPFSKVLELCNLKNTYHWYYKDLDYLENFFFENIVLIGDAAHPMLPFATQGVNSALQDAATLADYINTLFLSKKSVSEILQQYNHETKKHILKRFIGARMLAKQFKAIKTRGNLLAFSAII